MLQPGRDYNTDEFRPQGEILVCGGEEAIADEVQSGNLFVRLISPMHPGQFIDQVWAQKAVLFKDATEGKRIEHLKEEHMFGGDVQGILEGTPDGTAFVWFKGENGKAESVKFEDMAACARAFEKI